MKRVRLRIEGVKYSGRASSIPATPARQREYEYSRWIILHELRQCRAKRRISGLNTAKEIKKNQRELAKLRKEYPL